MVTKKKKKRRIGNKRSPGAGRPSKYSEKLLFEIKKLLLSGHKYYQCQEILKIAPGTWDRWTNENYEGFRDKLTIYSQEKKLRLADMHLDEVLEMGTEEDVIGIFGPITDKNTGKVLKKQNDRLLKIKTDTAVFIKETLDRNVYTKKSVLDVQETKKLIVLDDESED